MDAADDPLRWVNMDRVVSIRFEEEGDAARVAKLETKRSGTFWVRDPFSIEVVREYLYFQRGRKEELK